MVGALVPVGRCEVCLEPIPLCCHGLLAVHRTGRPRADCRGSHTKPLQLGDLNVATRDRAAALGLELPGGFAQPAMFPEDTPDKT
jgi:hypothetical protein